MQVELSLDMCLPFKVLAQAGTNHKRCIGDQILLRVLLFHASSAH